MRGVACVEYERLTYTRCICIREMFDASGRECVCMGKLFVYGSV